MRRDGRADDSEERTRMKARILVVDSWNVLSSILRTHRYQPIWTADGIQT